MVLSLCLTHTRTHTRTHMHTHTPAGWIAKLEVTKPEEHKGLLSYKEYTDTLEGDEA